MGSVQVTNSREGKVTLSEQADVMSAEKSSTLHCHSDVTLQQTLCDQRIMFWTESPTEIWRCVINTALEDTVQGPCLQRGTALQKCVTKLSIYLVTVVVGRCG